MGIKEMTLPSKLLNLPQPWGETDFMRRRTQLKTLSYEPHEIKTALNVLERCLHTLSLLPPLSELGNLIPESLMEYWDFTAQWLAQDMPTLDELRLFKIEGKLKECAIDSPSPELIKDVAEYWVWGVTRDIFEAALRWVKRALQKSREPILISRFLLIASRYWEKIKPRLGMSLLTASAIIGRQKALPLLEFVEQQPEAPELLKETAQNYRRYVLDNPEKWLPESQDKEELAQSKRVVTTQPAFGQLAMVPTS